MQFIASKKKSRKALLCIMLIAIMAVGAGLLTGCSGEKHEDVYVAPQAESITYNMNNDWRFTRAPKEQVWPLDVAQAAIAKNGKFFYEIDYDDSDWETVSLPHAISASDSFAERAVDGGDTGIFRGIAFYRKKFTVPADAEGKKVFVEFESARQAIYVWVNGEAVGYYEAGITASGFDLTPYIKYGEENVIAVVNDSSSARNMSEYLKETIPGTEWGSNNGLSYQWNTNDFNPTQGGLVGNVLLHVKSDLYQTLPLYNNLKTTGNYIYASDFDIAGKTATINVIAEIRNESTSDKDVVLEVNVVDNTGKLKYTFETAGQIAQATDKDAIFETAVEADVYSQEPEATAVKTVDVTYLTASFTAAELNFWSPDDPYLYDVYTILKCDDVVVDVEKITTGFRKVEYTSTGGLKINDEYIFLTGYAQRSTNEWAAVGVANDWLTDYDMELVKKSNANFIRWMHVAAKPAQIRSTDKYGIVSVMPAGDKEGDKTGRQWTQRVEAMRDTLIYFRNSPSVIFWEAGNSDISSAHMKEMRLMKELLDSDGGRYIGCRSLQTEEQVAEAEWVGTMLNRHVGQATSSMHAMGKFLPIIETEYHREEAPRRVWDDYSPPDYDYDSYLRVDGAKSTGYDVYDLTSEEFVLRGVSSYAEFFGNRVGGLNGKNYYSAAAALLWADSNQHGRNSGSENARVSGRVDAIRVEKQSYYAYQVMQARETAIHIVGHWSYPELTENTYWYNIKAAQNDGTTNVYLPTGEQAQRDPLHKTVYVVATTDCTKIELLVDGIVVGVSTEAEDYFLHSFENIDVTVGDKVEAVAYNEAGEVIARDEIKRSGEAYQLRLTATTGADGLMADGADYVMFDVEVLDKDGNVCVLNYDRIDFSISGEGVFLGGYNSGLFGEESVIAKDYVYAECGLNRVFVRSTTTAGDITLTATMEGVKSATVKVVSKAVKTEGGLTVLMPQNYKTVETIYQDSKVVIEGSDLYAPSEDIVIETNSFVQEGTPYTVTVNGTEVENTYAYKPNDTIGVQAALRPILYQIKKTGDSDITYKEEDGTLTLLTSGKLVIVKAGSTFLQIDKEKEGDLLSVAPEMTIDSVLVAELSAIMKYIDNVSFEVDDVNHIYKITVAEY